MGPWRARAWTAPTAPTPTRPTTGAAGPVGRQGSPPWSWLHAAHPWHRRPPSVAGHVPLWQASADAGRSSRAWTRQSPPRQDEPVRLAGRAEGDLMVRAATEVDGGLPVSGPGHPLRRLSADEIRLSRRVLAEHGLVGAHTRFTYLGLEEPPKAEVLGFRQGTPIDRRVRAILLEEATGAASDVVASLTRETVDSLVALDPARDEQPAIMLGDLEAVDEIVKGDADWRAAMARRGVTDLDLVRPCPLSAGSFGLPGEPGRRMLRVLSFVQHRDDDHPWAHPVDGLVAYVDLIERR